MAKLDASYRHGIDSCSQHRLSGWSTSPSIDIAINDGRIAHIAPDLPRDDLVAAGIGRAGRGLGFELLSIGYRGDDAFTAHLAKRGHTILPDHIRP
jgi:hypothetical protein